MHAHNRLHLFKNKIKTATTMKERRKKTHTKIDKNARVTRTKKNLRSAYICAMVLCYFLICMCVVVVDLNRSTFIIPMKCSW